MRGRFLLLLPCLSHQFVTLAGLPLLASGVHLEPPARIVRIDDRGAWQLLGSNVCRGYETCAFIATAAQDRSPGFDPALHAPVAAARYQSSSAGVAGLPDSASARSQPPTRSAPRRRWARNCAT